MAAARVPIVPCALLVPLCGLLCALLCTAPAATAQQSVADGFPPDILSRPLTLTGTTDIAPGQLDSGDVNEDGLPDVVGVNVINTDHVPCFIALFLGTPGGDLSTASLFDVPTLSLIDTPMPRFADLNADGHLDILGLYRSPGTVVTLLGHGDGSFEPKVFSGGGLNGTVPHFDVADIDDDGVPDLVASDGSFFSNQRIVWLRGFGDGRFAPAVKLLGARVPGAIVGRDLDADGLTDVAFIDSETYAESFVVVHRGLGKGAFAGGVAYPLGADPLGALVAADANGDGRLDLYNTGGIGNGGVRLLLGVRGGAFVPGASVAFAGIDPATFAVDDLDRDGVPDLIAAQGAHFKLQRMAENGPIGPVATVTAAGSAQIRDIEVVDLDDDGLLDLVAMKGPLAIRVLNTLEGFIDVGYGQTSGLGTPVLTVSGTPVAGQPILLGVALDSAVPALLFIGASSDLEPFHGGVLVPSPDLVLPILTDTSVAGQWPTTIPAGTAIHVQAVLAAGGGQTLNSNAVVMIAE